MKITGYCIAALAALVLRPGECAARNGGHAGMGDDDTAPTVMVRAQAEPLYTRIADTSVTPALRWRQLHFANAAILMPEESPNGLWCMYVRGTGYCSCHGQYHDQIGLFTQQPETFNPLGPWTECADNPVIRHGADGEGDNIHLLDCAPVWDGKKVWFYYQGVHGTQGHTGPRKGSLMCRAQTDSLGCAFSPSGVIVKDAVGCSDAVFHDGKYYLFYGYGYEGGKLKVDVAVTADPMDLSDATILNVLMPGGGPDDFDSRAVNGSRIFRLEGVDKWFMVYQGSSRHFDFPERFHVAYSDDLLTWTKVSDKTPFFTRGEPGTWDQGGIWFGEVFEHNDTLYMYYEGWGAPHPVADRDAEYFPEGCSSTGCAKVAKSRFLEWCGLCPSTAR